jgi:UDP-perosamine 4-acetyltransferase
MTDRVVIAGGGGHAKVVVDVMQRNGTEIAGCICPRGSYDVPDVDWLGENDDIQMLCEQGLTLVHVAIGDNALRSRLTKWFLEQGFRLASAISSQAIVSSKAIIGAGVAIMPGAVINAWAQIGDGVIVNTAASVDHDCRVDNYVHLAPGCRLAGNVHVGEGTFLGIGSTVIPGTRIGNWSVIGAGAVVIRPVPDDVTAVGVPARLIQKASKSSSSNQ